MKYVTDHPDDVAYTDIVDFLDAPYDFDGLEEGGNVSSHIADENHNLELDSAFVTLKWFHSD